MSSNRALAADEQLVLRCLAGDGEAWHAFYDRYHEGLLRYVLHLLGPVADRADLADEVMGRFWCALVEDGYDRLRRFDPARGPLRGYLTTIARQQVQRFYHSALRPGRQLVAVPEVHVSAPRPTRFRCRRS
jgi:DNA-directed RNA polymerase specialized sigma24 family protein